MCVGQTQPCSAAMLLVSCWLSCLWACSSALNAPLHNGFQGALVTKQDPLMHSLMHPEQCAAPHCAPFDPQSVFLARATGLPSRGYRQRRWNLGRAHAPGATQRPAVCPCRMCCLSSTPKFVAFLPCRGLSDGAGPRCTLTPGAVAAQ
eukprot:1162131-Pelagomonas_calceolata.AAC.2